MPAKTSPLVVHTASGIARGTEHSDQWGREAFHTGLVPTEVLINGKTPAVTDATFAKLAAALKARRPGYRVT
jgi:CTP:molybdopterin cytidylyltransferase MocA